MNEFITVEHRRASGPLRFDREAFDRAAAVVGLTAEQVLVAGGIPVGGTALMLGEVPGPVRRQRIAQVLGVSERELWPHAAVDGDA